MASQPSGTSACGFAIRERPICAELGKGAAAPASARLPSASAPAGLTGNSNHGVVRGQKEIDLVADCLPGP